MTQDTSGKKDTQRLQRAIVDGLEDVKGHDIQVYDTEHLSALFERVIIASGTSNRQTKALASSVRDAVREAGFPKPRIEGEDNGEWIIVDCGAAVAHIMQPAIRTYYHLEEIWGDKPVRLKFGTARPAVAAAPAPVAAGKAPLKTSLRRSSAAKSAAKAAADADKPKTPARKTSSRTGAKVAPRATVRGSARTPTRSAPAKALATGAPSSRAPAKAAGKTAAKAPVKTAAAKSPVKIVKVRAVSAKSPAKKSSGQTSNRKR